jgi:ribosomal protein S18 acetylase RimI-like enzyme
MLDDVRTPTTLAPVIRRATLADAPFITRLSEQAFSEYDPKARSAGLAMLRHAGARGWVALRGDEPLGFVILHEGRDDAAVNAIAVSPSERGRGVGRLLMSTVERYARARGKSRLTLVTAHANVAALDLFLRLGFVITRRQALRYARGQEACRLQKALR